MFRGAHLLSIMLKKGFGRSSLKTSAIASNVVLLEFARRPAPQAKAARANYNSNVLCSKALSSAAEDEAGERFSVEVQMYRIKVMLGVFLRTQCTAL